MNAGNDPVLACFAVLEETLERYERDSAAMRVRIEALAALRHEGRSWTEIVEGEERPLVVEMLSASAQALDRIGARVRRAEAHALHAEGMTMDGIARRFGVTRQRISAILRGANGRG